MVFSVIRVTIIRENLKRWVIEEKIFRIFHKEVQKRVQKRLFQQEKLQENNLLNKKAPFSAPKIVTRPKNMKQLTVGRPNSRNKISGARNIIIFKQAKMAQITNMSTFLNEKNGLAVLAEKISNSFAN
uniref:Uncharacterized protein n=1 Tax=Romanomermis culicivorax TaxID=13658 RepID=A0A915IAE8_ROMCU